MINYMIYFLISISILIFLILFIALSGQWFWFGIKYKIHKLKRGSNAGLFFVMNKDKNFGLPINIDLTEDSVEFGDKHNRKIHQYSDDQIAGFRFFGMPCVLADSNDTKTSVGIHYHQTNDNGEPQYQEDGSPTIGIMKPSRSLRPSAIKALIDSRAITQAIGQLFSKYQTQIYLLMGIGIAIGLGGFFLYDIKTTGLPDQTAKIEAIKASVDIIKDQVAMNVTRLN